ncbi:MAG: 30S ribosome-binding factor RbfA [Dehalococcoidia bacterium]|nr:30S ribosome-binding factor RbfA [Chloroflexota bacterium]MCK4221897.1 30S ribosome-binding factor RbfA [Dehalococcoidia bacterium]MCK4262532.1 30S ribosome-binding factor RbfA [Dehalococcoidia bacterium]MCK4579812.1 30S ribosome-binding factor RbfA [Dehalococcoidia bacterium]
MSRRTERLNKAIKQEISRLLEREVNDPRLGNLISVTEVSVSPDLKYAKVFVSILGNEENKTEMLAGFNSASGFLRRELASHLSLRTVPQLSFHYDDSIERGARVLELIRQVGNADKPLT